MIPCSLFEKALVNINDQPTFVLDEHGKIIHYNLMLEQLTGLNAPQLIHTPFQSLCTQPKQAEQLLKKARSNHQINQFKLSMVLASGDDATFFFRCIAIIGADAQLQGYVLRAEPQHHLQGLVAYDSVTGLPQRAYLFQKLEEEIKANPQQIIAIFVIDIDQFKKINLRENIQIGDDLINEVAFRLKLFIKHRYLIARGENDRFIIMLHPLEHVSEATKQARALLNKLCGPYTIDNRSFELSVSLGLSVYPNDASEGLMLIKKAELALSDAKARGGHQYRVSQELYLKETESKLLMEQALQMAFKNHEFSLHYQPIFNLATRSIVRFESLIRWQWNGVNIAPDVFVPLIEKMGWSKTLNQFIIQQMCSDEQLIRQKTRLNYGFALNLSIDHVDQELIKYLLKKIHEFRFSPECLYIELVESAFIDLNPRNKKILKKLRELNLQIAIDDFGVGYASLNYIRNIPFHHLKIDKSFVQSLPYETSSVAIIRAILNMSQTLGFAVTAEGIESEEQLSFLLAHGCHEGQGFLLAKPMAVDVLIPYLLSIRDGV